MRSMRATALLRPARLAAVPRLVSSLPLSAQRNMSTVSGLMQERPLLVSQLIDYAAKVRPLLRFPAFSAAPVPSPAPGSSVAEVLSASGYPGLRG